jgi:hypothetical protein
MKLQRHTLFGKYMPQWPAGARSYQTEVLGDAQGAVVLFTNTPQEFGHEIRGIAVGCQRARVPLN